MYILLEFVGCVGLVFGAMAALFAASVTYITLKEKIPILVQTLYRFAQQAGRLLARSEGLARRGGGQLLKGSEIVVAVGAITAAERPGLIPLGSIRSQLAGPREKS